MDEYLHFNRYRRITLESAIYDKLLKFPLALYNEWCEPDGVAEQKCLQAGSYGGKWHNESTDRQFGISNVPGNLSGNGSSRWKQRAFNDYRKDVLPLLTNRPLVRISIYDKIKTNIGELAVGQILNAPDFMAYSAPIIALIESRLFNIEK